MPINKQKRDAKETENNFVDIEKRLRQIKTPGAAMKARKAAISWYTQKMGRKIRGSHNSLIKGRRATKAYRPGQMFMYQYDSKLYHEGKLDYFDKYPLMIFLDVQKNGNLLGLNLHYLSPFVRAKVLAALIKPIKAKRMRHDVRMRITYGMVKSISQYKPLAFALKSYIPGRIQGKFVRVPSNEWDKMIMMPTARFVGKSNKGVWKDSGSI